MKKLLVITLVLCTLLIPVTASAHETGEAHEEPVTSSTTADTVLGVAAVAILCGGIYFLNRNRKS